MKPHRIQHKGLIHINTRKLAWIGLLSKFKGGEIVDRNIQAIIDDNARLDMHYILINKRKLWKTRVAMRIIWNFIFRIVRFFVGMVVFFNPSSGMALSDDPKVSCSINSQIRWNKICNHVTINLKITQRATIPVLMRRRIATKLDWKNANNKNRKRLKSRRILKIINSKDKRYGKSLPYLQYTQVF